MFKSHRKKRLIAVVGMASALSLATLGFFRASDSDLFLKIHHSIDVFSRVYKEIAVNYVDEVDPDRFMRAGIDGMLKTLDPYTVYIGEKENDEIDLVTTGKYGGVGVTIGQRDGMITVINLLEGFSASKQGLEIGDRIVEIDGKNVVGLSLEDIRLLVRGTPGTEVRLRIEREGESHPLDFVLLREEIPVRNVTYSGFVEKGIGYIRLERFSRTAGDDLRSAIKEIKAQGDVKGLVLDLRDNPGGLLDIAVDVTSKFLPESSLVVSTRGRKSEADRKYYSTEAPMLPDVPVAILVDRGTASASEIVAGAIQDLDRGIIIGTRTFGKGLVQTITRLSENTSIKVTTARYYTPSGRCIQEIDYFHRSKDGVFPTIPDSLKKEFRTSHDRKVLEGGGIEPDSTVPELDRIKLIDELLRKAMFFKFANHYASEHKTLPANFEVTDSMIEEFESYEKDKKFEYEEEGQLKLKELKEIATKSRYDKPFFDEVKRMESLINQEKERQVHRYQEEVRSLLRTEIIGRMKGEKAQIESTFADDEQLEVAVNLLKDKRQYQSLLRGKAKK